MRRLIACTVARMLKAYYTVMVSVRKRKYTAIYLLYLTRPVDQPTSLGPTGLLILDLSGENSNGGSRELTQTTPTLKS
jgi:hypothetical protein